MLVHVNFVYRVGSNPYDYDLIIRPNVTITQLMIISWLAGRVFKVG